MYSFLFLKRYLIYGFNLQLYVCQMIFAAKLLPGEPTLITALMPGTLVLSNFTLQEGCSEGSVYLKVGEEDILIVALEHSRSTAYHTEIQLTLSERGKQKIVAKKGNIHLLGHFVPRDQSKEIKSIDEALTIKKGQLKQIKESQPRIEPAPQVKRESGKMEAKQKQEQTSDAAPRRGLRVRTPQPPPKPSSKPKKQIKFNTGSKEKSLLQLMYNLNDDEEDDESDYSEEDEPSSSSSSSQSEEDSDQTPKRNPTKKEARQQKIQRKNDQSDQLLDEAIENIDDNTKQTQPIIPGKQSNSQENNSFKNLSISASAEGINDAMPQSVKKEISNRASIIANRIIEKALQQLPLHPTIQALEGCSGPTATHSKSYQQTWLDKFRKLTNNIEAKILAFSSKGEEERGAGQKQLLLENQKLREQLNALRGAAKESSSKESSVQGLKTQGCKKQGETPPQFAYRIPTTLPSFMLRK